MKREIATAMLMLPIGMITLLPKSALATERSFSSERSQVIIVADQDNNRRYDDRWDNNRRYDDRWDNNRRYDNRWDNNRRSDNWRNNQYYEQYGNRRVWIPGHWERGFLGIGRRWVEGHWEYRR
jgi:hypothetical protein